MIDLAEILAELRKHASAENVAGMARYGISSQGTLGVTMPVVRNLARTVGKNHALAAQLWQSGIHEARILATLIDIPAEATSAQMDRWASDFDSWDVCDQACQNLFRYTPIAFTKAAQWATKKPEFVRRAGFSLMAGLAVKAKKARDDEFEPFFALMIGAANDERNMVKKAVNWALRQIGKRSHRLHPQAIETAIKIAAQDSKSARWIASDALRELRNPAIIARIERRPAH